VPEAPLHYPIDTKAAAPSTKAFDLQTALADLFGLKTVESMFRLDDFPRRLAATIDNLGRSHASVTLWPVNPVGDRFIVEERDGVTFIGADNGLRYTPYVLLLETVDLRQAVGIYVRIYPSLQRAYEELGYPGRYLNDRLVEVIDLLLATPENDAPVQVRLPPIEGPLRPGVLGCSTSSSTRTCSPWHRVKGRSAWGGSTSVGQDPAGGGSPPADGRSSSDKARVS
jgi:hypothetical protein